MPPRLAALGLVLGLFVSPAVRAQNTAVVLDCVSNGAVTVGAFTAQPSTTVSEGGMNVLNYFVVLRANRALSFVHPLMSHASGVAHQIIGQQESPFTGLSVTLPVGQDVRYWVGSRAGARLSDAQLRAALRVTCRPA